MQHSGCQLFKFLAKSESGYEGAYWTHQFKVRRKPNAGFGFGAKVKELHSKSKIDISRKTSARLSRVEFINGVEVFCNGGLLSKRCPHEYS